MGSKVEADVAMSPPLSLFCREETRDGDTYEFYAPDSYRSTATYAIVFRKDAQVQRLAAHRFGSAHEYRITIARRTTRRVGFYSPRSVLMLSVALLSQFLTLRLPSPIIPLSLTHGCHLRRNARPDQAWAWDVFTVSNLIPRLSLLPTQINAPSTHPSDTYWELSNELNLAKLNRPCLYSL